jgi:hypothetical protein
MARSLSSAANRATLNSCALDSHAAKVQPRTQALAAISRVVTQPQALDRTPGTLQQLSHLIYI